MPINAHVRVWCIIVVLAGAGLGATPGVRHRVEQSSNRAIEQSKSGAQDHSPVTTSATAPPDTNTFDYVSRGVHVIQRVTPGNDIVAVRLYLMGGVLQLTPTNAGIEELTLRTLPYGSQHYPGGASRHAFSLTGSRWSYESGSDWSRVGFVGIADRFDSSWTVFADRVVHPTLDSASIALVRARMIRELHLIDLSPERLSDLLADSLGVQGHPYAVHAYGSLESLPSLSPAMVRNYVATEFVTSRLLLVVVGNVSREHLDALVTATLGTLPAGDYVRTAPPELPSRHTNVVSVSRPTATSYIVGWYSGPSFASKDYPAFELATSFLSGWLNHSIREHEVLSYAAYARPDARAMSSGGMYVSTRDPKTVIPMMQRIVDSLKTMNTQYQSWYLGDFTKEFRGGFLMENETNEGQAAALARAQILLGDYRLAAAEVQRYHGVGLGDVIAAARRYMHDVQFAYVGDTSHFRADWVRR